MVSYSKMMAGGITAPALSMPFGSAGAPTPAFRGPIPVKASAPQIKYLLGVSALKQKYSDPIDGIYSRAPKSYAPSSAIPAGNGYALRQHGWQI